MVYPTYQNNRRKIEEEKGKEEEENHTNKKTIKESGYLVTKGLQSHGD